MILRLVVPQYCAGQKSWQAQTFIQNSARAQPHAQNHRSKSTSSWSSKRPSKIKTRSTAVYKHLARMVREGRLDPLKLMISGPRNVIRLHTGVTQRYYGKGADTDTFLIPGRVFEFL